MSRDAIFDECLKICRKHWNITHAIQDNSSFEDDLDADSLDRIELLLIIEETFHIEISDEEGDKIVYFSDMIDLIEEKLS